MSYCRGVLNGRNKIESNKIETIPKWNPNIEHYNRKTLYIFLFLTFR